MLFRSGTREITQNATGDAAVGHFVPIGPLSPDPITGDAYLLGFAIFPARKNGVVSAISSGPLGPGFAKIAATAISQLRLSLPNQRSRSVFPRRGDPCGRPEHGSAGVRPLRKKTPCGYPVGAAHRAARRSPPHNLIPAAAKTLSIRGAPYFRSSPCRISPQLPPLEKGDRHKRGSNEPQQSQRPAVQIGRASCRERV